MSHCKPGRGEAYFSWGLDNQVRRDESEEMRPAGVLGPRGSAPHFTDTQEREKKLLIWAVG